MEWKSECERLRTETLEQAIERIKKRLMATHDVEEVEEIIKRLLGDSSSKRRFAQG